MNNQLIDDKPNNTHIKKFVLETSDCEIFVLKIKNRKYYPTFYPTNKN